MKEYIIIVNGTISDFDSLEELNKALADLAGCNLPIYTFSKFVSFSKILQRGDDESASDYMDRLKAAGQTEPEFYV